MDTINKTYEILKNIKLIKETIKHKMETSFKDFNFTGPQSMLIGVLGHNGQMKVSELSKRMGLSNSTVSGIIDRLELQGFVVRIRDTTDRRVILVDLEATFRKEAKEKYCAIDVQLNELIKNADDSELDDILNGLNTLNRVLKREKEGQKNV